MGARQFVADLAQAKAVAFENISKIRRGDSDGEISFEYCNKLLNEPIGIQILATDVTSYPEDSTFMAFTSSECHDEGIFQLLENITAATGGSTVQEVIQWISDKLTARVGYNERDSPGSLSSDSASSSDFETIEAVNDGFFGGGLEEDNSETLPASQTEHNTSQFCQEDLERLRKDMQQAKTSGLGVSLLSADLDYGIEAISLSIRAARLGIPREALDAWGIHPEEFLILLFQYRNSYLKLGNLNTRTDVTQNDIQFRFGKCRSAKPSLATTRTAFDNIGKSSADCDLEESVSRGNGTDSNFHAIKMSTTINALLNQSFVKLLELRRNANLTWDGALAELFNLEREGKESARLETLLRNGMTGAAMEGRDCIIPESASVPESLRNDHAVVSKDVNMPMVAMQFALKHFCRCTEYCMVCHQKIESELKSLKPYVCFNDLCLYQYLSLGLGPSIEHEVTNSPHVVDLLISFFWSAISQHSLREFPTGLGLKMPYIHYTQIVLIEGCLASGMIRVKSDSASRYIIMRKNDWFVMLMRTERGIERHICHITTQIEDNMYTFTSLEFNISAYNVPNIDISAALPNKSGRDDEWNQAILFPYTQDPDELSFTDRDDSLKMLLLGMPSVLDMRSYLLTPGHQLSSWSRLNKSTLALVRWIVASNRSYIVQDDAVPVTFGGGRTTPPETDRSVSTSNKIKGIEDDWMQFRFAQGSPEKELEFINVLRKVGPPKTRYPSIFAWHGSPMRNWHSIIRTSLDFQTSVHGRSFGNGVYLSSEMSVSSGYSGAAPRINRAAVGTYDYWPKSDLRIASAISVCEVVNRPEMFVSRTPHFVLDRTDWIQCRYLLLSVNPSDEAIRVPEPVPIGQKNSGYIPQDPNATIVGMTGQPLEIPTTAIPPTRRQAPDTTSLRLDKDMKNVEEIDPYTSDSDDGLDGMFATLAGTGKGKKRPHSDSDENMDIRSPLTDSNSRDMEIDVTDLKRTNDGPVNAESVSTFRPGALDRSSLPQLPEPTWAASSPAALQTLNRELKELHDIQMNHDCYTLGWYIDTNEISNLFQWIVELHSFDSELPLAKDMERSGHSSIIMEVRFGSGFPMAPPFVRVIRPRFLPFAQGGGGHVTAGGAICSELLTNSGWSPALSMEKVLLQVRLGLCDMNPPARLATGHSQSNMDYGIGEAVDAYRRAARAHGWQVATGLNEMAAT